MKSIVYAYDLGGNITSVSEYAYQTGSSVSGSATATKSYTYGDSNWKDKLTKYNGTTITYDAIGNPLSYYNGYTFTWTQGRKLSTASNGTDSISYAYNSDGIRIKKTVNGTATTYTLDGTKVIRESNGTDVIWYYYDEGNTPVAFKLNGTLYAYTKNMQGDITGIVNTAGTKLVSYVYDAWGKVTATNVAGNSTGSTLIVKNPYLYRGYRYDSETGFYYLNSRYYDPGTGRFINADDAAYLGADGEVLSYNLFAYCLNNPVNRIDEGGTLSFWGNILVGIAVIATIAAVSVATAGAGTAGVVAAIHCFATGALGGAIAGAATGAVTGAAAGAITHRIETGSWEGAGQAALQGSSEGFLAGATVGALTGGITSNVCFIAGTVILTAEGAKAIEEIIAGDLVLSWDEETGEVRTRPVLQTYVNETEELVHIRTTGEEIISTPGHPFYSPVKGWTSAIELRAGDILVLVNDEYVVVEQVQHEILEAPVKVFNFSVADFHTYYVSDSGVLVHNACGDIGTYNQLHRAERGSGHEVHHIIEKRFIELTNYSSQGRMR